MDLSPLAFNAIIAGVAVLLYLFIWWSTAGLPRVVRVISRVALAIVVIAPVAFAVLQEMQLTKSAPPRDRVATAPAPRVEAERMPAPVQAPPPPPRVSTQPPPPVPPLAQAPPPAAAPPPVLSPAPPAAAPPADADDESSLPGGGAPPAGRRGVRSAPPAPAGNLWDTVPVFYGTDRAVNPAAKRLDYGSERGKRLQLGYTLVSVPKSHEVPLVERPWVYHLPFTSIELYREAEDPARHFTLKEIRELNKQEFLELVRKRLEGSNGYKDHAVVFVHGFNTSFDAAIYRTAQLAYDLKFDGAPFTYSWPSKGALGLQDYSYDRESAEQAVPYLGEFLELVAKETGAKSLTIIAHSMGNQVLLRTLRELRRAAPPNVEISQVILAAPDVDRDNFELLAKEIQGVSKGVTMFSAANDWALNASRRFWGGIPRAGDVPPEGPLVVPGLDTIDVTALNTDMLSLNHSGYAEKTALLNDLQLLIQTGERPPEKRIPILQKIETAKGVYWKYPPQK